MDYVELTKKIFWHLLQTAVLALAMIIIFPILLTFLNFIFQGNVIIYCIAAWFFIGIYYALPHRIQLDRNVTLMREFRKKIPDGTYSRKQDAKEILHSKAYWTDVCALLVTAFVAVLLIILAMFAFEWMPPILFNYAEEHGLGFVWLFFPAAVLLTASYGIFYLWFTISVHKSWDETRLHLDEELHMDETIK